MTTDRETRSASLSTERARAARTPRDRLALARTLLRPRGARRRLPPGGALGEPDAVELRFEQEERCSAGGRRCRRGGRAADLGHRHHAGDGGEPRRWFAEPIEGGEPVTAQPESLPPDIAVTVGDTLVVPGENVELLAQASVDVIGISLSDGLHNGIAFAYDGDARAWRTSYRVPLRPHGDRISLSVTAKNDVGRWCRHWVFLSVDRGTTTAPEEAR